MLNVFKDDFSFAARAQLAVPLRRGGLGLDCTSDQEALAAWCAGAAQAQQALTAAPIFMQPSKGSYGTEVQALWSALHGACECLHEKPANIIAAGTAGSIAQAQRTASRAVALESHEALLKSCDLTTAESAATATRIRSSASYEAGAFLDALPHLNGRLALNDSNDRIACLARIGALKVPPCDVGTRCACGHRIQLTDGEHAHICSKTGRPISTCHNLVTNERCQAGRRAGCSSSIKPSLGQLRRRTVAPAGDQCAGDVLTIMPAGPLVLDTTIVCLNLCVLTYGTAAATVWTTW